MIRNVTSNTRCLCGATATREIQIPPDIHPDATAIEVRSTVRRCVRCRESYDEMPRDICLVLIGSPELLDRENE